jgi:predicted permease
MQMPSLVFSLLLASIYGAAFHLWQGRRARDLPVFWLAAVLGFAAGHFLGQKWGLVPWTLGQIHLVEATAGALLFLAIARLLRLEKKTA